MIPAHLARFSHPIPVLDQGFVRLVGTLGDDGSIVTAARVTTGKGRSEHVWGSGLDALARHRCTLCNTPDTGAGFGEEGEAVGEPEWPPYCVEGDRRFLRFMLRERHSAPFEFAEIVLHVRAPMDVWRQWIRHRTACLAGDVALQFDLPGGITRRGNQLQTLTVGEIYDRFQPTVNKSRPARQKNPYHKRSRVQAKHLRCLDECDMTVRHTRIVDVWESGVKPTYRVELVTGEVVTMSADHRCLTSTGWLRLHDIVTLPTAEDARWAYRSGPTAFVTVGPGIGTGVSPKPNAVDPETEEWRPVLGWEHYYEVSSQGRVRRIVGGKGSQRGRCKCMSPNRGRTRVGLNRPGEERVEHVHVLMLEAFRGPRPAGMDGCHEDGNSLNNAIENLRWGTSQSNADDRVRDGATTRLSSRQGTIKGITYAGEQMTYDIEVEGPWHNFSADGMIVHNSVQEYSTRYSAAIDATATTDPGAWRRQSPSGANRQGSAGFLTEWPEDVTDDRAWQRTPGEYLSAREQGLHDLAREVYEERLTLGVAREQARKDLPLSTFTEAYWKIDLHNLMHFLSLRMDGHAQHEIRQYANVIGDVVRTWVPLTWEAFRDCRLEGATLTRQQIAVLRATLAGTDPGLIRSLFTSLPEAHGGSERETANLLKLIGLGATTSHHPTRRTST